MIGMVEYYVIRDKNTGLYFRGKGANRWGKHYNQATIYRVKGTAERSIKEIAWHGEQAEIVPIRIIENAPDVAKVVLCKDCKHQVKTWISDARRKEKGYYIYDCELCEDGELGHDDDFCSYGERKDNG